MAAFVDWKRAEQVALRVAARHPQPITGSIHSDDFTSIARLAEDRVEATTGLRSLAGPARVQVIDRADWIRANIASFRALIDPMLSKLTQNSRTHWIAAPAQAITSQVAGAEVGLMLGWMSGRVLGQYDLLFGRAGDDATDTGSPAIDDGAVYLVGPNMLALENTFGFPPGEFRLWVTLHELTHRAQFTGVPWMRDYFVGLVHDTIDLVQPDPAQLAVALRDAWSDREGAMQRLRDGGIAAMVATPEQQAMFAKTSGLMSLLEGHGDVVMDRAGTDLIPSAARFSRVLHERRKRVNPIGRFIQRLIGLEGKMGQYAAGEKFIAAIEAEHGERAVDVCWQGPHNLPSLDEIRKPQTWLDRVHAQAAVA